MDCCELALHNAKLAQSIAFGAFSTIVLCLAIMRNYYIKMKGLTVELKKKNGHEQSQINNINSLLDKSNKQINQLKGQLQSIQASLSAKDQKIKQLKAKS